MNALILVALLIIPSLNVRVPIYFAPYYEKTWDIRHIGSSVALLEGSAYPDEYGNTVLAGHYAVPPSLTDGPFMRLSELTTGDIIQITYNDIVYEYEVDRYFIVGKKDLSIVNPTSDKRLTLFTCTQAIANEYRYVVVARFRETREEEIMLTSTASIVPTVYIPTNIPMTTTAVRSTYTPIATEIPPTSTVTVTSTPVYVETRQPIVVVERPRSYVGLFILSSLLAALLTGVFAWRNR